MTEYIQQVNDLEEVIRFEKKIVAHQKGLLHLAFSILIYNSNEDILLQKRSEDKYHSGGLWSNACCGHPRPGETIEGAAHRRLEEELDFDCDLKPIGKIRYRAEFANGIIENEIDHLFQGVYEGKVAPDPEEVESIKWISAKDLKKEVSKNPAKYTVWFREILAKGYVKATNSRK